MPPRTAASASTLHQTAISVAMLSLALGCRAAHVVHDAEYLPLASAPLIEQASAQSIALALVPVAPALEGPHSVEEFVAYALSQNPQIQAKRKRVEAAAQRVPQAASLKDPNLAVMGFPFYPYVQQTAGGRMQANLTVSQEVPWFGKLRTQADAAEAEVDMARAELVAVELEVIEQVKRAYYELYFIDRAIEITQESRKLASHLESVAEARYVAALVSQQDLLRAQLEVANLDTELVRLRQELVSAQARLARLLHVSPDTPVRSLPALPAEDLPRDLEALYAQALTARPELHAQLAAVRRDRLATDRARLDYFPDLTYEFGWGPMTTSGALAPTADGLDNLSIGMMANVPIYRRRLAAGVCEAEAKAVASAREYDDLRDRTEADIKDLFAQATSQEELLRLFRTVIVPKADQTLQASISAYEAGQVGFLQLIDNWRELLRYQIMQQRLEAQLRQTLASLERVVGGITPHSQALPAVPPQPATFVDDAIDGTESASPIGDDSDAVEWRAVPR